MEYLLINTTYLILITIIVMAINTIFKLFKYKTIATIFLINATIFLINLFLFLIIDCNIIQHLTK